MSIWEFNEELYREAMREDALEDGRNEGLRQGLQQGLQQGILRKRVELICRKLKKGKSVEQIAEELEENPENLQSIIDTAERFAPEYDVDSILQELDLSLHHFPDSPSENIL